MQKITPFIWYENKAEEAVNFYVSIFKNAKIKALTRYPEGSPGEVGSVMTISFELEGQEFVAINGWPQFKLNEAISFVINCKSQEEIDLFWEKLSEGGEKRQCGWLKDKFGLSWQIVPENMGEIMEGAGPEKSKDVMAALLKMEKIDISALKEAGQ
jgi:predicted 3-demethylubiquinone-9 3-methyltransferase (glyoxalase superfamily)